MLVDNPLVYIVVLNFNGKHHLEYCLPSILKTYYDNFKIIMVDNSSNDDSVEYVKEDYPDIHIIQAGANLGWAGGNNLGVEYARQNNADIVCLANNDIVVHPLWVLSAVKAFKSDRAIGFAGCNVYGAIKVEPYDYFTTASKELSDITYEITNNFIDGMALFIRMSVFDLIGDIDEKYFAYAEETDLEIRGHKAGFKKAKTNVPVWHYSSGTFKKMKLKASFLAIRNNIRLSIKHDSPLKIIKKVLSTYKTSCNPFFKGDMSNVTIYRQRPKNVLFNFFLVTYSILWNIKNLRQTLKRKSYEYSLIKNSREET